VTTVIPRAPLDSVDGLPGAVPPALAADGKCKDGGRLVILDVFRLTAALLVVSWHLAFASHVHNGAVLWVARHGWMGVELFFMISGFVICMSSWGRGLGEFFVSRVVRLYPAYWFAVLLTTAVLTVWPIHQRPLGQLGVVANLTMLQQFLMVPNVDDSYWTLAVELLFYLLFAVVVWRGVTYRRVVTFCVMWTVAAIIAPQTGAPWLVTVFASPYAPYFIAGVALYLMHRFGPTLLLWGILGMSYMIALAGLPALNYFAHVPLPGAGAVITVFFAAMIAVALGWFRWFRWRIGIVAGALTYPLYLIHQTVGLTIVDEARLHLRLPPAALFLGTVAVMLVAAYLIYRLVERPGQRCLKRALQRSLRVMDQPDPAKRPSVGLADR
jgi:peptidoglycan/LPS O-acetylase OafA/YrhL